MATLKELRKLAKEMEIPYEKRTNKEDLENMIAEKMAELGIEMEEVPKKEPVEAPVKMVPVEAKKEPDKMPVEAKAKITFENAVRINPLKLNDEFMTQAGYYYHFAKAEGVANSEVMKSKLLLETVEADLFKEIRANFVTEGVKPTEKMVAAEVVKNKRYLGAKKNLIDATLTHSIAKAGRDAFVQRKDMLIQLGLSKRQEKDQNIKIMHEKAKEAIAA
jgi:hypothetical protein